MIVVEEELLDAKDVASMLKLNSQTVKRLANRGELRGFRIGTQWRFRRSDINKYIDERIQREQSDKREE